MVRSANERSSTFWVASVAWVVASAMLVAYDFGVIAFCGSILLAIWAFGLREKFSDEETASAYSVFNQDGKAIVGGLTASQFDRQMRGGLQDDTNNPVKGSVAVAAGYSTTSTATLPAPSEEERLRRRKAAAAAAERRFQQKASN